MKFLCAHIHTYIHSYIYAASALLALELPKNSAAVHKISSLCVFIISVWFNEVRDCVAINIVDQLTAV